MKKSLALSFFLAFCGCRAQMMETRGDTISLTQLGKPTGKSGVVRYLNTGLTSWREARRRDAEKQMAQFCGGAFTILEEGPRSKFGSSMPIGKSVSFEVDQYQYLSFRCEKT